jgi:hypothetical protein
MTGCFRFIGFGTVIALFVSNCKIHSKEQIMSENNIEYRSLCSTCRNAADCTYQKDRQKPSLYCEEFEIDICPPVKTAGEEKSSLITPVDAKDEDSSNFMGLCSNCDNHSTCAFPKPEGGIWHCEEYQ